MAVLTFKSEEIKSFPSILREYAGYVGNIKGNSEKTVCEYLLDLRTFFRYMKVKDNAYDMTRDDFEKIGIKDLALEDVGKVTSSHIMEFLIFLQHTRDNRTAARTRKISALRSFFHYVCEKKHYIENNPTRDIDAPKKGKTLPKFMSLEDCILLLETVRADTESKTVERDYSIIVLFLNTGMRLSELVGLNLESFNSDLTTVKVLGKGNKERMIYLNHAAQSAVKSYLKIRLDPRFITTSDKAFFLSTRQQRISGKTVQWMIYKYLDMAGLGDRGLSVHKLRHTAATLMYQSGKVDIRVLKDVLGHEQLNTTQIYTHLTSSNLEQAVDSNPLSDVIIKRKN